MRLLGILGGVGVEAGLHFCHQLSEFTKSPIEQENLRYILYNNPTIPDRTTALKNGDVTELFEETVKSIEVLKAAGCTDVIIACNTLHAIYDDLVEFVDINVISIIQSTVDFVKVEGLHKGLLLGTDGLMISNVYKKLQIAKPHPSLQQKVMDLIYKVKSGDEYSDLVKEIVEEIKLMDPGYVVLGCTELSYLTKEFEQFCTVDLLVCVLNEIKIDFL